MSKQEMGNLLTVSELSSLRWLSEHKCATEQGIRVQVKELESGKKQPADVGFELVRPTKSIVLLRLVDADMERFRLELKEFARKKAPKEK